MSEASSARIIRLLALREKLAEKEHERWADWQRYFHSKCTRNADGSLTVPAGYVAALERQITTPFTALSAEEQRADRDEVDRYWPLVVAEIRRGAGR